MINGIKKTLNWSYERGSWQYDLLCLLIIAVIFLVPSRFFSERDRGGLAGGTASIPAEIGEITQVEVEVERLKQFLELNRRPTLVEFPVEALGFYLREQYNRPVRILRYDQYLDTEKRVWYRVSFSLG
ncbi:MAG: hypothetical protein ACOYLN_07640 [Blastocatellia bacterium]|jgi:hypothetical protein